ncbi:MAG: ComEC/Rec2 family competence protein [Chloroflexota bacterium]|nr:ComEC/Rec2 family competence protein [Chloroflexota bacterium]
MRLPSERLPMQTPSKKENKHYSPFSGFLPFFWLALACLGGILLAYLIKIPPWVWILGIAASLLLWVLILTLPKKLSLTHLLRKWTRTDRRLPGLILSAIFFVGGWRYAATRPVITPDHISFYNDRGMVQLIGTLIQPPDPRDSHTNLIVSVDSLRVLNEDLPEAASNQMSGQILIQVQPWHEFKYGDQLLITGQLETPFEGADFSYRDFLAYRDIFSLMSYAKVEKIASGHGKPIKAFLYRLQDKSLATLHDLFQSPESDLLAGILLGHDQGLSDELNGAFRKTGTAHIIAISGFNIVILAGLFSGVFTRLLGRRWGALTAVVGIVGYTLLIGGEPAVVRAAIMGGLGVLGGMFGRRQNGLNSLGLAAMPMLLINPNLLWDIGFQLSAAATLGLILYAQPLEERFILIASKRMPEERAQKLVGPASEFLLFTLAAQVMTLPIIAYHFGGVSWLALIANPLILPPQSLVLILGGLALLTGIILPGLGKIIAILAAPFVRYTVHMVSWLAHLPGRDVTLPKFHVLWLVIFYVVLFIVTLLPREQRKTIFNKAFSFQMGLVLLVGGVFFMWNRVLTIPDDRLHLTLLDDKGTYLIQSPAGNAVLVGGGESPSHLKQVLGQFLPADDNKLNAVIVGSAALDDLNGLTDGLPHTQVEMVLWGGDPEVNRTSAAVYTSFFNRTVPISAMEIGQLLDLGEGVLLHVLWVGERGAVLWLEWHNFTALLPTGKVEDHWLSTPLPPQVILLPDDLKAETLPLPILNNWAPSVLLLPLEETDLPLQGEYELFSLLENDPLVSTLEYEWVRIDTDGKQLWVHGE